MKYYDLLITGGDGYIAKSLNEKLSKDYNVKVISRRDFDLTSPVQAYNFFIDKYFKVVLHCAISGGDISVKDNVDTLDNNLMMYYNLLKNRSYKKFINFGSGAEVYKSEEPYGLSKKIIRKSILEKDDFFNLRLYALFDENELDRRFIKSNIRRYINREDLLINRNKKMDFFHMDDFLKLVNYYIETEYPPKEIDCVYPEKTTLYDITKIINNLSDYSVEIKIDSEGLEDNYIGTFQDLGIKYKGLKDGIKEVYNIFMNKAQ